MVLANGLFFGPVTRASSANNLATVYEVFMCILTASFSFGKI